jgi:hypothetical protein
MRLKLPNLGLCNFDFFAGGMGQSTKNIELPIPLKIIQNQM